VIKIYRLFCFRLQKPKDSLMTSGSTGPLRRRVDTLSTTSLKAVSETVKMVEIDTKNYVLSTEKIYYFGDAFVGG
jgi:hypothetical protein